MGNQSELYVKVNSYLRRRSNKRSNGVVTADDVHAYINKNKIRLNRNRKLSLINSVFSNSEFLNVGQTASTRPAARYRRISMWMAL